MTVSRSRVSADAVLHGPGKRSVQIVWPGTAPDARVTITRVVMEPGAVSPRHNHPRSEQVWLVEQGEATLLLGDGRVEGIAAGDVVRTSPGEVHGVENTGPEPFAYLTVTCPPEDMSGFYEKRSDEDRT